MRLAPIAAVVLAACGPAAPAPTTPAPAPATPVARPEPEPEPAEPLPRASDDKRLPDLYNCWFESPYQYMFDNSDRFTAGTRGLVWYGNLAGCMARLNDGGFSRVVGDVGPIETYAGLEVFVSKTGPFRRYNPALIRWGHENLIPPPDTTLGDLSARDRYHAQFSRFFRLMTETYLTLHSSLPLDAETAAYQAAVDGGADGLDYLEKRFAGLLPDLAMAPDGTALTVPMAFGFWLRRAVDDTHGELWIGLRKVMRLYDPEWYATARKRYANASVNW